ncbi:MmgE/PrpD family protein [Amycolatopsis sp. NPDC051903]|uniref:MmgE/PrpD family protein n=1 Tax=Amycolatopsis sp. NPDC051903 TaxID=3363936 RepID=UPI003795D263
MRAARCGPSRSATEWPPAWRPPSAPGTCCRAGCQEATAGALGAVAAAGCAAGLSAGPLRHAVGLCATQAAGLSAAAETPLGPLQVGKAAANAVEAVLLSRSGFTSAEQPLEGRRGLYALLSEGD